jgi:hypothetical protein
MLDLPFGRLTVGEIDHRGDVVGDGALVALDRHGVEPRRIELAAFAPVPDFSAPTSLAIDAIPQMPVEGVVMLVRSHLVRLLSHDLFVGVAGDFGEGAIDP